MFEWPRPRRVPYFSHYARSPIAGCKDKRILGEVLRDPGFELGQANINGGLLPGYSGLGDTFPASRWGQGSAPWLWNVVTDDPETGTYHVRASVTGTGAENSSRGPSEVLAVRKMDCALNRPYSAKVDVGDTVTFSVRAKASDLGGAVPVMRIIIDAIRANFTIVQEDLVSPEMTLSYATYSHSFVMPANTIFVRTYFWPITININDGPQPPVVYDVDNASLDIS